MNSTKKENQVTDALEDYLETIYLLIRDQKFARIKDIAKARDVKSGSVSPAMKRLDELGLITYVKREYIVLTPEGEKKARRVFARHQLLEHFFKDVLNMSPKAAQEDACAMEHNLSDEAMDRFVRLFEFLEVCTEGRDLLEKFRGCSRVHEDIPCMKEDCKSAHRPEVLEAEQLMSISDLQPGQSGRVTKVNGHGAIRQRLLDMGVFPRVEIEVERVAPAGDPIWIKLQGYQISLRLNEAASVMVTKI